MWAFSKVVASGGYSLVVVLGLLMAVASLVAPPPAINLSQHQGLFQSVKFFWILEINDYPTLNTVLRITHNACTILKHKGSFQSMLVIIIIIPLGHRISSSL